MSKKKATIDDVIALLHPSPPMFEITPTKTALLLINLVDYTESLLQMAVQANLPKDEVLDALGDFDLRSRKTAANAAKLLKACRGRGFEIVHVISARASEELQRVNTSLSVTDTATLTETSNSKVYEEVASKKGELVFHKASGDAFAGTKLDQVLRNMHVDSLIICGLATDHDVLFTTVQAVNLGYTIILASDACTTFKEKTHETFMEWYKTFVVTKTAEEILKLIT